MNFPQIASFAFFERTAITSMLVAMGHMGDGEQLERAFAGASIHEIFNVLSVCILLPIEILTHYLFHLTRVMLPGEPKNNGESWEGPIKKFVTPLTHKIIKSNKKLIEAIAGDSSITCDSYYPVYCEDGVESYDTCTRVGLIACDKDSNECPLFFRNGATKKEDHVSGGVCLFLGIFIIIICLVALVTLLQRMLLAVSSRIIYKTSNINPYLAMIVGSGITMLVQSSSTTISILTPLTGLGLLTLEQMFPLTLGANIGTSVTALMAASVQDKIASLHVALAHLFFNVTGILIWYPIPYMRYIPLTLARGKGKATRLWRGFPVVYVTLIFFVFPLLLLGISALFEKKTPGYTALGGLLVILVGFGLLYFTFWWKCREGRDTFNAWMAKRERHHVIIKCLPENMDKLNALPEVVELLRAELASLLVEKADGTPEKVRDISSNATICTQEGTSTRHHEDIGSMKIEEGLNNPVLEQMPSNLSETYD